MPASTSKEAWEKALGRKVSDAEVKKLNAPAGGAGPQVRGKSEPASADAPTQSRPESAYAGSELYTKDKTGTKTVSKSLPQAKRDLLGSFEKSNKQDPATWSATVESPLYAQPMSQLDAARAEYGGPGYVPPRPTLTSGYTQHRVPADLIENARIKYGNPHYQPNSQTPMGEVMPLAPPPPEAAREVNPNKPMTPEERARLDEMLASIAQLPPGWK